MGSRTSWVLWMALGLALAAGCKSAVPNVKPPPQPEALNVPPPGDKRYERPPNYPKDALNLDPFGRKQAPDAMGLKGALMPVGGGR